MKYELDSLLQKKMRHKDVPRHIGLGLAIVTRVIKTLHSLSDSLSGRALQYGYCYNDYGAKIAPNRRI